MSTTTARWCRWVSLHRWKETRLKSSLTSHLPCVISIGYQCSDKCRVPTGTRMHNRHNDMFKKKLVSLTEKQAEWLCTQAAEQSISESEYLRRVLSDQMREQEIGSGRGWYVRAWRECTDQGLTEELHLGCTSHTSRPKYALAGPFPSVDECVLAFNHILSIDTAGIFTKFCKE